MKVPEGVHVNIESFAGRWFADVYVENLRVYIFISDHARGVEKQVEELLTAHPEWR